VFIEVVDYKYLTTPPVDLLNSPFQSCTGPAYLFYCKLNHNSYIIYTPLSLKHHTMSSSLPKPLPQVPGPKLAPFTRTAHASIQFIKELGEPGADGHVWEVRIRGQPYALKMVSDDIPSAIYPEPAVS
jgi:hypothetical protein